VLPGLGHLVSGYPVVYEVRDDGVYLVCREIPDLPGVIAEQRIPDELVAAWLAERPTHCPDCGERLAHIGEDDEGNPLEQWCLHCEWEEWPTDG
jgi:hypothetical protein